MLIFLKGTWPLIRTILKPLSLLMHYTKFGLNRPSGPKKDEIVKSLREQ